jgi:hypothetical protein
MRKPNLETMSRAELKEEAERLEIQFPKNIPTNKLVKLIEDFNATSLVEQPPVIDVVAEDNDDPVIEEQAVKAVPRKPVVKRRSWAGAYVLLCDAKVNDGKHKLGEVVELSDEDARVLKRQGAIELG